MSKKNNIIPHDHKIDKLSRSKIKGHKPKLIWFTGLSGSGKSTLAGKLEEEFFKRGVHTYMLDGDNIRLGLNKDLGFSLDDRTENIRRIAEVSKLFIDAGLVVLAAFVSPLRKDRDFVRSLFSEEEFVEVFVDCPLEVCEQRDTKGLYAKARRGEIKDFTGISSPFEAPIQSEFTIKTNKNDVTNSLKAILDHLKDEIKE